MPVGGHPLQCLRYWSVNLGKIHRRFLADADVRRRLGFFLRNELPKRDGPKQDLQSQNFSKKKIQFFCSAAGTTWRVWTVHRLVHEFRHRPSYRAPYTSKFFRKKDRTDFPHPCFLKVFPRGVSSRCFLKVFPAHVCSLNLS